MSIIDEYLKLADQERWKEALPLIEEIVRRSPDISTSCFNMGVCKDGVGDHAGAFKAFERAYALQPDDFGAQFRMLRSLYLASDFTRLLHRLETEAQKYPEIIDACKKYEPLSGLQNRPEFALLLSRRPEPD